MAALGGSPGSPTTGRSSSSAGTSRRPPTTATRSRPSSSQSPRPNGSRAARCANCSSTKRPARPDRSRSSPTTGPCFKAARFAAFIARRPELIHIRTRRKSPRQNGVRERAFGSRKYEHLYRQEIDDGHQLGREVESYRRVFNTIRSHEALGQKRPLDVHLEACNDPQTIKSNEPELLPLSRRGTNPQIHLPRAELGCTHCRECPGSEGPSEEDLDPSSWPDLPLDQDTAPGPGVATDLNQKRR